MSSNPPATESSLPSLPKPQTIQQRSQNDPPALSESEAMRRMQDLLKSKKFSISDTVVFEYNQYSFTAQIMPDGSLKSNPQQHSTHPEASQPFKLYSSPSEFASDMAARAALLDEKVTRPRGKSSINGWNHCTINGRALAMIRSEMLHERKNENANVSKEKAKDPACTSVGSAPSEPGSGELLISPDGPPEQSTTCRNPISQDSQPQSDLWKSKDPSRDPSKDASKPTPEAEKEDAPIRVEEKAAKKETHSDLAGNQSVTRKLHGEMDLNSASRSHHESDHESRPISADRSKSELSAQKDTEQGGDSKRDGSSVFRKDSSLEERSVINLSGEESREATRSAQTPNSGCDFDEVTRQPNVSDGGKDFNSKHKSDMKLDGPAKEKANLEENLSYLESPEQEVNLCKDNPTIKREENVSASRKENLDIEAQAIFSSDTPSQRKAHESQEQVVNRSRAQAEIDQIGDNIYGNISEPKNHRDATDGLKDTPEIFEGDDRMEEERNESIEPLESGENAPRDSTSPQPAPSQSRSLKEVSDLQQEILGDSDSDEESFIEQERKSVSLLKKRSRSPPIHTNKKRKRIGECGSPETGGRAAAEGLAQIASKEERDHGPRVATNVESEVEGTQLDPETMEAAAIAAQIEKEEASNRARRTTRLAAGKIKQVDYKTSAVAQVPQSVSPGHGSEENDRNSNDNESPTETTRTTRRRSAPNQMYPPQRSSRRVAKLRSSQEKDHSSNDEIDNPATRCSSGGNGSEWRSDRETAQIEDTEEIKGQGPRPNGTGTDGNDRRRGKIDSSGKRSRHAYHEDGDHDSQGRAYSTRASTRENSLADAAEITDLGDPNDFLSESEDVEDEDSIENRSNGHGFTVADLTCIADAVKTCGSTDHTDVLEALGEQDSWKGDELRNQKVEAFLLEIVDSVQNLSRSLTLTPAEVNIEQVLSFLSNEVWRLSTGGLVTGIPQKPLAVLKKATREDQVRSTLERSRRKEHRDVEEMRGTLEKEMESRRRAELDTLYIEIQVSEATRALSRERARCDRVDQETEKYKDMEADIRKRLEKAKILVGQLRGEKYESEGANGNAKKEEHHDETLRVDPRPNGSFATSPVLATRNSATSDDDVEMIDKNITTTSQRLLEMDRLRVLIAAREAEAEEFQRICEKERMRFVGTLDLKNRLETEIYLYRSHGSVTYGAGNASVLPVPNKLSKENGKKSDHRGPSTYGNRGPGYVKQKSGFGRNVSSVPPVTSLKNSASTSKTKPGPGKANEAPRPAKRKPIVKNGGNSSEKL